jgi:hypothetical protein
MKVAMLWRNFFHILYTFAHDNDKNLRVLWDIKTIHKSVLDEIIC